MAFAAIQDLRPLTTDLNDAIDVLNTLSDQVACARAAAEDSVIAQVCPDWKQRLQAKLTAETSTAIAVLARDLKRLGKNIAVLERSLTDGDAATKPSASYEADLVVLLTHLKAIHTEYSEFVGESGDVFDDIASGKRKATEKEIVRKLSLIDGGPDRFEIRSVYVRIRDDLSILVEGAASGNKVK